VRRFRSVGACVWGIALALALAGCGELPGETSDDAKGAGAGGTPQRPVVFVGFDASEPLVAALRAEQLRGLVLQNPVQIGETSVRTLVAHLEGQPVESTISTGELLATPQNMDDEAIRERLEPPRMAGAGDAGGVTGPKRKKWRVMVIPKGTTHVFWQSVHFGANRAAEALGNVEVVWLSPTKEDDRLDQIALVQRAITSKVDGLVIAPLDAQALARPVEDAIAAGIPVVVMDSGLASEQPVSYVATDNYHGGVLGAERLAELLDGEGRVILMRYAPNSEATEQRERGFLDTIKKYPKIQIISEDQFAGATAESAQQVAQKLVFRFKGQVDGIFTPNESSTAGMLRALLDAGMLPRAR
jgi:ribose transport system substrate-binding protein